MKRWLWPLILVLVAGFVGLGLSRVRFNTEILDLFPSELPEIGSLKLYQKNFQGRDELVITVEAPESWGKGQERAEKLEAAARSLGGYLMDNASRNLPQPMFRSVLVEAPWAGFNPDSTELLAYYWLNQKPEAFAELTARTQAPGREDAIAQAIEKLSSVDPMEMGRAGYDPLGFLNLPGQGPWASQSNQGDLFVSPDGKMRLIFAYLPQKEGFASYKEGKAWLEKLRGVITAWQHVDRPEFKEVHVGLTGTPVFVAEISSSMMKDMLGSVTLTTLLISLLFWLVYRRLSPLVMLLFTLAVGLALTFAAGGLLLGDINAVSVGFAAILLGLTADYGLILYQESSRFPSLSAQALRRKVAPSIWWASLTTAAVFCALQISSFRGVSQLGILVAFGIITGAAIMLYLFLPLWIWRRRKWLVNHAADPVHTLGHLWMPRSLALGVTAVLALGVLVTLSWRGLPGIDGGTEALQPHDSPAFQTLERLHTSFDRANGKERIFLLFHAPTLEETLAKIRQAQPTLDRAKASGLVEEYTLPLGLLPAVERQQANLAPARDLAARAPEIRAALQEAGFEGDALALVDRVLAEFGQLAAAPQAPPIWPRNEVSRWALEQVISVPNGSAAPGGAEFVALGMLNPAPGSGAQALREGLAGTEILLTSWKYLGPNILAIVEGDLGQLMAIMSVVLLIMLWLVFRRFSEVFLSLAGMAFSTLLLLTAMQLGGIKWNLMNLMAIPLMLGVGVDYSIHLQLALQRHDGSLAETFRGIGLALLLCGATTCIGFSSLIGASSNGLITLGLVCTMGVGISALVSVFLLPAWWQLAHPKETTAEETAPKPSAQPKP